MYVATDRGTSDNTEATRFSQCAHDQRRRLEAEDCDSIRCAKLISGGRRRIRPPRCLAHARPTMCCIRLVMWSSLLLDLSKLPTYWASVSEPHTCDFNATFSLLGVTIVTPIRNDHGRFRSPHANVLGRLVPNCLPT